LLELFSPDSQCWISLIPVTVLLSAVCLIRRSLESMVLAIAVGFMLTDGVSFLPAMLDALMGVLQDPKLGSVAFLVAGFLSM